MCKVVLEFYVVPSTARFLDNLSFFTADSLLQLIVFAYQILHKEVIKFRRFGSAMQLTIHDKAKNTIEYVVQAPNEYASAYFFPKGHFVFYPLLTFFVLPPVSIILNDSHKLNSSKTPLITFAMVTAVPAFI